MKTIRVGVFTLVSLVLSGVLATPAQADVRLVQPVQTLPRPPGSSFPGWGQDVAIDGGHIIVLAAYEGGQQALLYRRSRSDGRWVYRRALVTYTGAPVRAEVAMKNGLAVVQFADQISLFEFSGGDYVRATTAAPIRHHGGLAISGARVLIGGNNCDYDAVIYEKGTGGSWAVTGRIDDNQGECIYPYEQYAVELHYDYALLREPSGREARAWRRNGSALDWVPAGTLALLPTEGVTVDGTFALQGATAVAPNGIVWRRSGASTWTRQSVLTGVDHENAFGPIFDVVYRDGVLVASEYARYVSIPRVYFEASPGQFDHVASLATYQRIGAHDVSGRTAVISLQDSYGSANNQVQVFSLASQLRVPAPLVNDFEDRNISDLTFQGGQFALATRGSDDVLIQGSSSGLAVAVMSESDWIDHQRIEADVTPSFGAAGSWVGLVARYVDADNYYYLALRGDQTYGIYKRVNGVESSLFEGGFVNQPTRATLRVSGNQISVSFGFLPGGTVTDNSLSHGRGGVATWLARADFDDVHVSGADEYLLFDREWGFGGSDYAIGLEELSGDWAVLEDGDPENSSLIGLLQRDPSGDARAVIGIPVANQDLNARMRVDAFAASQQGAWIGLLARYVDARNHYYVTMRSTGQVQIRKMVNGVITVLATANLAAVPGRYYNVRFLVMNDQLHLYVDHLLVATAHDRDIARGRYGIATYRAAANWHSFWVLQP